MNSSIHRITLDVAEAASHSAVTLRQGENAHRLEISFTDNGRPYSLSGECYAVFAARKSDGTQLLNACTIVNNTVIYDLTAQTTAAPGRLSCEVRLYGETNKLIIAPKFSLFVEDSAIDEEGIESTDEFSALNDLLSRAATVSVFKIKGYFESAEALEDIASPAVGDTYGIGTQPPYEIYNWDAANGEWVNHGTLQGEPGEPGQDGQDGAPGQPGQTGPQGEPGVSGVYVGGGTAPEAYNVQIDPNGSADELVTEAPSDGKQYARKNKQWEEVTGGGGSSDSLWRPTVDSSGNISWAKSTSSTAPTMQNIKGPQGPKGDKGDIGETGPQGIQGIQGPPGQDGSDAEVTAENIAAALGYTPADEDDLSGKLDTTGGTMTGGIKFSFNGAYVSLNNTPVVAAFSTEVDIGHQSRPLMLRGSTNRPQYKKGSENPADLALLSDLDAKADRPTVKTTMDSVAVAGAQYYLGTQSAVSIVLPSSAEVGQQIAVVWYNGATAATLSISGTTIGESFTPTANSRSKVVLEWDGTNWAISHEEISLN